MLKKITIALAIFSWLLFFGQAGRALTILSPVVEMEAEPGQTQKGILKVFNETQEDLTLVSSVEPFAAGGESGQPVYLLPEEKDKFLQWFKLENESILIKPGQFAVISFSVEVPIEAPPGGYYAAIFWQKESRPGPQKNSGLGVSGKAGALILLKVKGDLKETGEIVEFSANSEKNYFFGLPVDFVVRFANSGNIHLAPAGEIELKSWLGKTEKLEFNPAKRNILPASIRRFEVVWGQTGGKEFFSGALAELKHLSFGRYTATLNLSFGAEAGQKIHRRLNFWIIPARLIAVFSALIFISAGLFKINAKVNRLKKKGHGKKK